jgi:hypothetical protein
MKNDEEFISANLSKNEVLENSMFSSIINKTKSLVKNIFKENEETIDKYERIDLENENNILELSSEDEVFETEVTEVLDNTPIEIINVEDNIKKKKLILEVLTRFNPIFTIIIALIISLISPESAFFKIIFTLLLITPLTTTIIMTSHIIMNNKEKNWNKIYITMTYWILSQSNIITTITLSILYNSIIFDTFVIFLFLGILIAEIISIIFIVRFSNQENIKGIEYIKMNNLNNLIYHYMALFLYDIFNIVLFTIYNIANKVVNGFVIAPILLIELGVAVFLIKIFEIDFANQMYGFTIMIVLVQIFLTWLNFYFGILVLVVSYFIFYFIFVVFIDNVKENYKTMFE